MMNEPSDTLVNVGSGVRESLSLSGLSTAGEEGKEREEEKRRRIGRGQLSSSLGSRSSSRIVRPAEKGGSGE